MFTTVKIFFIATALLFNGQSRQLKVEMSGLDECLQHTYEMISRDPAELGAISITAGCAKEAPTQRVHD